MKQSKYFIPTTKQIPADAKIASHQILLQGGYVKQTAAGIYSYLPLGLKVLQNIEHVVRTEMNTAAAIEVLMPLVQPLELWKESGRDADYGPELLRMVDRHQRDFALGPTHEEVVTDIARDFLQSYKKMPVTLYQIQTKFRDELRPRFGLLRGREFLMMDAYSFGATSADLDESYRAMALAYNNIFQRLMLDYRQVDALSGEIGGTESAEFMALSPVGEDTIIYSDSSNFSANLEVFPDLVEGSPSPDGNGVIKYAKGIEIGHIFKLGTKYSEAMRAKFVANTGKQEDIIMGCYGIGVSRLIMAVLEQNQQENVVTWPLSVAPFAVHILIANMKDESQVQHAEQLYQALIKLNIRVLCDERNERLGAKFGDADLIGAPLRIVVGMGIATGVVEFTNRLTAAKTDVNITDIVAVIQTIYTA